MYIQAILVLIYILNMLLGWVTIISGKGRKYLVIVVIIHTLILVCLPIVSQPRILNVAVWRITGVLIMLFGIAIAALARIEFAKIKMRAFNLPSKLLTKGIYGFVRHPQYLGLVIFYIGWSLVLGAIYSLYIAPIIIFLHWLQAYLEERYILEKKFGSEYIAYRKHVGMFLPRIHRKENK